MFEFQFRIEFLFWLPYLFYFEFFRSDYQQNICYMFDQLWMAVRAPPFHVEVNTSLFQKDYFIIALSMLVFGPVDGSFGNVDNPNYVKYVRPMSKETDKTKTYLLDILHSDIDKRIMQPDRTVGYIHHVDKWYVYIPFRNDVHEMYIEAPFRRQTLRASHPINIAKYLKESTVTMNYESQKLKFREKYENVPIERLATVVGKFSLQFHQQFVEEIIQYVFTMWTNPTVTAKSEMHEFYFKMLYYYDVMGLVVWASGAKEFIREMYKPYILPVIGAPSSKKPEKTDTTDVHALRMSLSRSSSTSANKTVSSRINKEEFQASLKSSIALLSSRSSSLKSAKKKKPDVIVRAEARLLPIGHFMSSTPRFYHPEKQWFESPEYVQQTQEYKENDIIIGYYEKAGSGLRIKFKIRSPIHKIKKFRDVRMIEKGSMCTSNSKEFLVDLATRLKIPGVKGKVNVPNLCQEIEAKLQMNELEERQKKSNIRWFYTLWDSQPMGRGARTSASNGVSSSTTTS